MNRTDLRGLLELLSEWIYVQHLEKDLTHSGVHTSVWKCRSWMCSSWSGGHGGWVWGPAPCIEPPTLEAQPEIPRPWKWPLSEHVIWWPFFPSRRRADGPAGESPPRVSGYVIHSLPSLEEGGKVMRAALCWVQTMCQTLDLCGQLNNGPKDMQVPNPLNLWMWPYIAKRGLRVWLN